MAPRLELRDVHKTYPGGVQAVRGISLSLQRGEFVSLLGPSGCGKSTTLSIIAGFEQATAGQLLVDGVVIDQLPPQKRGIGLVFQDYAVFSRMSVRGNLGFGLEARRVPSAERRRQVDAMADKLGLLGMLDRRGDSLNMSEMQRVALGRVLITGPELVLLDEPMSNLDASLRASLRGELKQIQQELGQTVLYVTHDQVEAMSMSDRIAVMNHGELLQVGTPEQIYDQPATRFVAEFIGEPPINLFDCEVHVQEGAAFASSPLLDGLALGSSKALASGTHALAIRPHDVELRLEGMPGDVAGTVRYVENLGAEHVLHVQVAGELVRAATAPGFAAEGDAVHVRLPGRHLLLIERDTDLVTRVDSLSEAAA